MPSAFSTDSCCDTVTKVQSYEGHSESVSCPYESQYQNSLKYICRGNRPSTCLQQALITSDTKQNGRFRLDDDKMSGKFTVNISSLTKNDSGSYLCGVQRNSDLDVFSAVELEMNVSCVHENKMVRAVSYTLFSAYLEMPGKTSTQITGKPVKDVFQYELLLINMYLLQK
uniref:Ig-like domain-containing protein n=1 Tax=Maylandia zebra TaxID=106582 RepID=A0A3P9BFR9_9CICH